MILTRQSVAIPLLTIAIALNGFFISEIQQKVAQCEAQSLRAFILAADSRIMTYGDQLDILVLSNNEITGQGPKPSQFPDLFSQLQANLKVQKKNLELADRLIEEHKKAISCQEMSRVSVYILVTLNALLAGFLALVSSMKAPSIPTPANNRRNPSHQRGAKKKSIRKEV